MASFDELAFGLTGKGLLATGWGALKTSVLCPPIAATFPKNGVYYHLTNCDHQWTQWVPPGVIRDELGKALRCNANRYVLFNVGDLREIPLSIAAAMDFAWNAEAGFLSLVTCNSLK